MHRRVLHLLSVLVLVAALSGASIGVAAGREQAGRWKFTPLSGEAVHAEKTQTSSIARSDKRLLKRTDDQRVNVVVKYKYDSVAAYNGGVRNLRATSPQVTGRPLAQNRVAVAKYRSYITRSERRINNAVRSSVPSARIRGSFRTVYGGVAMTIPANRARSLLRVKGVVAVQKDRLAHPLTDATPEFLGATEVWAQLSGPTTGEGVIVGVLDTGVWPEHPSFNDPGVDHPGGTFGCEFGDGSDPLLGDPFECNDKLIGAYAFVNTYMTFIGADEGEFCNNDTGECSARDANGHGTHTSTTAAGAPVDQVDIFDIPKPPISGMAPGAHVIGYRVCLELGCFQSDSVAAVEQALIDGVDVINFSISGGGDAYTDPVELAFLDAYAGGISVNASAGNAGPGEATADHAGPWTTTVGASTSNRHWLTTLRVQADNGETFEATGATITPGIAEPTPVVFATEVGTDKFCSTPLEDGAAEGLVVICERGVVGRNMKSWNLYQGDAAGMILYNPTNQDLFTDNFWVPTVMIEGPSPAEEFLAFMESHSGETATWETGVATPVRGDVMTVFSSRGPLGDFIKPDVTAPGLQILAGHTPQPAPIAQPDVGPPGELFQSISGTSMSSPHSAGVSALVKAAHPNWTPGQIKSALMTSSVQDVLKEDHVTPADPFDRGAGSIRANRAIDPTVTFDVPASDYIAAANDPVNRVHLNLPSINVPTFAGELTTTRTMMNVSGERQRMTPSVQAPDGVSIRVRPSQFTLAPGRTQTVSITISAAGVDEGQYFGQITFNADPGPIPAVIPVAFNKTTGAETAVTLDNSCEPTEIAVRERAGCQVTVVNTSPSPAEATLEVTAEDGLRIENVSPPGVPEGNGFTWSGTLEGALAPEIVSITEGGAPSSYLPLEDFGVPPIEGVGDETIVNVDTPEFLYGSETYTRLGMVSNGYTVVGGGESDDVVFVPTDIPNPAPPNNIIAPFWTDLNPEDGGEMRVGILEDTVTGDAWIVQDWNDIATFGNPADVHDFQIWTQIGDTEGNHMVYGDVGVGSSDGLNAGAENRDGTSGQELPTIPPPDDSEWTINTAPPEPGGSVTITYDAVGIRPGVHDIVAELTSDLTVGTIVDIVTITVTQ